ILLAAYFNIADLALIFQVHYYRRRNRLRHYEEIVDTGCPIGEQTSLLRSHSSSPPPSSFHSRLQKFLEISVGIIGVCLTGLIAYYFSSISQDVKNSDNVIPLMFAQKYEGQHLEILPQICGWTSTSLY
ncbi:6744_t:CDS:1, partial [Acaulospora colombiana]